VLAAQLKLRRTHPRNSSAAVLTLSNEERSSFSQMASFPVVCLRSSIAALALSSLRAAIYTLAFLVNSAYAHSHTQEENGEIISSTEQQTGSRAKYLSSLFADTGVAPSDDNDFPGEVRNVVDSELGLWSEPAFDDNRVERSKEDGEPTRARHV
jgi:hypothetical protein